MDYRQYNVEDFLQDDSFVKWVLHKDKEAGRFWEEWLRENPCKQGEADSARKYLLAFTASQNLFTGEDIETMWQNIETAIDRRTSFAARIRYLITWKLAAACVVLLMVTAAALLVVDQYFPVVVKTGYTQRKTIVLPDGSGVVLNTNTSVTYKRWWFLHPARKVAVTGEAFFSVVHTADNRPFAVTLNGPEVNVLGTSFNVWAYGNRAQVVLARGKVQLQLNSGAAVTMQPGELVEIKNVHRQQYAHYRVDTALYTAWKTGDMIFTEASLEEIAGLLKNRYGYTVVTEDKDLFKKKITTKVSNDNVDLLLALLSESLPAAITKKDKTITVRMLPEK